MSAHSLLARPRRTFTSVAAAAALALAGVATAAPASEAAETGDNAAVTTVTPTSVVNGSTTTFTVSVTGGNLTSSNTASRVEVDVPSGFTGANVVAGSFTQSTGLNWSQSFISPRTLVFVQGNASHGLGSSDSLSVQVRATASGSGDQTWTTRAYKGTQSTSQALPVLDSSSPVVTIAGGTQVITFDTLADKTYGDPDFNVSATSTSSANPITFTSGATDDCTVTGTSVHLTGAGSCTITAHQAAGNGYTAAADVSQTFSIAKASQSITFAAIPDKTYNDSDITLGATASSGLDVSYAASGNCSVSGSTLSITGAGSCSVTASQAGNDNYDAASDVTRSFGIAKASATVNVSDLQYTYDGQPHAATVTTNPTGLDVTVTYSKDGSPVATPTAAGNYDVTATIDDANYAGNETGVLSIARATVTGHFTVSGKTYDGDNSATVTGRSLTGVIGPDEVALTGGTATFDSKNAGSRTATLSGASLTGADAANYTLGTVESASATIDRLEISATLTAGDKTYDGGTVAGGSVSTLSASLVGVLGSDDVDVAIDSASFDDKNVGSRTVNAAVHLTGGDAGNYTLASDTISDPASISQKIVNGSFTAADKVYDGTTAATISGTSLPGVISGDSVSLDVTGAAFADKNVGSDKTVTASLALSGGDAGNYLLGLGTASTTAEIAFRSVAGSFTAADKQWDGTNAATITSRNLAAASGDTGKIATDDLSLTGGSATFADAAVGNGKTVTGSGFSLTGADAGNYTLTPAQPWTTTAAISPLYRGTGFYQPVDMPTVTNPIVWNTIKGGQTVPLKFEVFNAQSGVEQTALTIFGADATTQAKAFSAVTVSCSTGTSATEDAIEMTTTGGTSLRYDTTGGQFIQNWKTPTTTGACYKVSVKTVDGSMVGPAYFKIK